MKYGLNDRPGPAAFILYGLQWWVVSLPCVIIMGVVAARLHFTEAGQQVYYLRKLFAVTGLAMTVQLFWGHRLPLVVGPATILLAGVVASLASGIEAVYGAALTGGAVLAAASITGLMTKLRYFFTPRIVAVVLVLIGFTLAPVMLRLSLGAGADQALNLAFGLTLALAMIVINQVLKGVWKSMTVLIGLAGGSLAYFAIFGFPALQAAPPAEGVFFLSGIRFEPGVILAFIICMIALAINEIGSIEAVGHMLKADRMEDRVKKGLAYQGGCNALAGAMGVLGPVSFSLSAGIIAATGCASRYVLLPAALGLLVCYFFPGAVVVFTLLPGPVMGALLLYLMSAQIASGLTLLVDEKGVQSFGAGVTVSFPLMVGLMVSFAPADVFAGLPGLVRPIAANGFIMGALAVVLLEHLIIKPGHQR